MRDGFNKLTKAPPQPITRRTALKTFGVGLAGLALARLGPRDAQAIVNGTLDGDAHPNVGGFAWRRNPRTLMPPAVVTGSGVLIHPRVVLTAGHGTYLVENLIAGGSFTIDDLLVSFASDASDQDTWHPISSVLTHPDFAAKQNIPNGGGAVPVADVGVAILTEPVREISPMPLPPLGFLDDLRAAGKLRRSDQTKITIVGYGLELDAEFPPDGLRRVAQAEFQNLHDRWLTLDKNISHDNGGGGNGDSGGPVLFVDPDTGEESLVAIMSRGVEYRVDSDEALGFLNAVIESVIAGEL